jgi:hypothetical protein
MLDVKVIAESVAQDIETFGHWRGEWHRPEETCCIYINPTIGRYRPDSASWEALSTALAAKIGLDIEGVEGSLFDWNDNTDTKTVLDTLRSL